MDLDPEEDIMVMKLARFFEDNINYSSFYNPMDWRKRARFWIEITRSVGVSKHLDPRHFAEGNFGFDPVNGIYELLSGIYKEHPEKFAQLLNEILHRFKLHDFCEKNKKSECAKPYSTNEECSACSEKNLADLYNLNRFLSVFGFELSDSLEMNTVSGVLNVRREDRENVFAFLNAYPSEREALKGAIERYANGGSDAFRQCMDSCRNLVETLVKKLTNATVWTDGLGTLMQSSTKKDLIKKLHSYLSDQKYLAKRKLS